MAFVLNGFLYSTQIQIFRLHSNLWFSHIFYYFWKYIPTKLLVSLCWHFFIQFRFSQTFTVIKFMTTMLWMKIMSKFRTIRCWSALSSVTLVSVNSINLYFPIYILCISHSIDICTVAIKNIWNKHAASTNLIADIDGSLTIISVI